MSFLQLKCIVVVLHFDFETNILRCSWHEFTLLY